MTSTTWKGKRGSVLLGPTEDRVARYLADATRHGRVTIRTMDIAERLGLERSEAYRITARLRVLGLFGVENDRGGTLGGRRWWRTATPHDGARLDAVRHRAAWSRIVGWGRRRSSMLADRLAALRVRAVAPGSTTAGTRDAIGQSDGPAGLPRPAGPSFREMFARAPGGAALLEAWGVR